MQRPFEITVLGTSSATPTRDRNPSAHYVRMDKHCFLVDCGEGTQLQLTKYNLRMQKIKYVLISHLHGDHYFGLPGLITSMALFGRLEPLYVVGPEALKPLMDQILLMGDAHLTFELRYIFTDPVNHQRLIEEDDFYIETIPLQHRVPCTGFLIGEKGPERRINVEACEKWHVPVGEYEGLKYGANHTRANGEVIANEVLTFEGYKNRRFAYISDTIYDPGIVPFIRNVNALYHESTFLHDRLDRAKQTFHTTALQAGEIAKMAQADLLILGHYSARYLDLEPLLLEAQQNHANTQLGKEGKTYTVIS